jgi:hypothetical protein
MKTLIIGLVISLLSIFNSNLYAEEFPKFKARVSLQVSVSAEENIKGISNSYLSRELRSLQDVELVDRNPEWVLSVIIMDLTTKRETKVGFVISVMIMRKFPNDYLMSRLTKSEDKEYFKDITSDLYFSPDHRMNTGALADLRDMCSEIVAYFDTKHLEPTRKIHKRFLDRLGTKGSIK